MNTNQSKIEEEILKNKETKCKAMKPEIGLMPKELYYERIKTERFNDVCNKISIFMHAKLKIKVEWIEEYNDLVGRV